jgi:hypothetical protein
MGHSVFRAMKNNILFTSNLSLDFLNILIYIIKNPTFYNEFSVFIEFIFLIKFIKY